MSKEERYFAEDKRKERRYLADLDRADARAWDYELNPRHQVDLGSLHELTFLNRLSYGFYLLSLGEDGGLEES